MPTCESPLNFHSKIFRDETYPRFIMQFVEEIKEALTQLDVWFAFSVFDPRKLPENLEVEDSYGEEEIHNSWYGVQKSDTYEGKAKFQKEDLEADKLWAVWPGFLHLMHEQGITYQKTSTSRLSTKNQKRVKKVWDYQNHNICHLNF